MKHKVNLAGFDARRSPRIVAEHEGDDVMVVKGEGGFVGHSRPETNDACLVLSVDLDIEMRDRTVTLGPGELFAVPAGVGHRPFAHVEKRLVIIEPRGMPDAGDPDTAVAKPRA